MWRNHISVLLLLIYLNNELPIATRRNTSIYSHVYVIVTIHQGPAGVYDRIAHCYDAYALVYELGLSLLCSENCLLCFLALLQFCAYYATDYMLLHSQLC